MCLFGQLTKWASRAPAASIIILPQLGHLAMSHHLQIEWIIPILLATGKLPKLD